jgi:hypothetical protein
MSDSLGAAANSQGSCLSNSVVSYEEGYQQLNLQPMEQAVKQQQMAS